ncbi:T9SS type A sorting domain-containing protein [Flavisolibacter tropicus]|uniref:T9SS type A sorting domain-containing protein n=1 Tax=Flavisolibacter tropicus TaxID=1492898 RepID=UPI00082CC275|nr:T9SS type A sorting domain-containing protein [Flavisolibacter tropicus]
MRTFYSRALWVLVLLFLLSTAVSAQYVTGQIIRPCTSSTGKNILDPNNATDGSSNDYASKAITGFGTTTAIPDIDNSEIPYKPVPPYALEPYSDLRRGPDHLFSDYVPDVNGGAYYMHYDGTNFLFRFRMGTIIPGAKGYSLLFDTDGKFGPTGPNADPNYVPATTGTGGNPGFEIEIVLCTGGANDGIQVYNVDGTDKPGASVVTNLTNWLNYSQIAIAATADNGDPDFLLDFYVPKTVFTGAPFNLDLTTTRLRVIPTTVMSPQGAIGGPKSDIYGLNDDAYPNTNVEYETLLGAQPGLLISDWGGTSTATPSKQCTAPPTITNSSLAAGNVTITGSWTKGSLTGLEQTTATIKVYKIPSGSTTGTLVATIPNITSGINNWSTASITPAINVSAGDVIYATAVATNESECLKSNTLQVPPTCNASNRPSIPTFDATCTSTNKGISGTNYTNTNWTIHIDNLSTNTFYSSKNAADQTSAGFGTAAITGPNWTFSGGCKTGSPMSEGAYKIYYTDDNNGGCASEPLYLCVGAGSNKIAGTLTAPAITTPSGAVFNTATRTISGTTDATTNGTSLVLYVDGVPSASTTATAAGAFTFSNFNMLAGSPGLSFSSGQKLYITSEYNAGTAKTSYCAAQTPTYNISCYTAPPIINTNSLGSLTIGQAITGTSISPAGTTIKIYTATSPTTPVATITVQNDGTWTTGSYVALANTTYYATAQDGSCGVSIQTGSITTASGATTGRCAAASITTSPLYSSTTSVGGAIGSSATAAKIMLYEDGNLLDSSASLTSVSTWTISNLKLYAGNGATTGKLTLAVKEGIKEAEVCSNSYFVLPSGCVTPSTGSLTITPAGSQTIAAGQSATYGFQSPTSGVFYSIVDQSSGGSLASGVWSTGTDFSVITRPLTTNTVAVVKGASLTANGESCSATIASRSVSVTPAPLPIHLLEFNGSHKENGNVLFWRTALEVNASHFEVERSTTASNFSKIGRVNLQGSGSVYRFTDNQLSSATNYYRLKMVDTDGTFSYSRIIAIHSEGMLQSTAVWPNPFSEELNIETYLSESGRINIRLLNESGSQVGFKQAGGHQGINNIKFECPKNLPPGIYILQLQTNEGMSQQKLIRINN